MQVKSTRSVSLVFCAGVFVLILSPRLQGQQDANANSHDMLSRQFTKSATTAMVSIHELKESIANVISKNLPNGSYNPTLAARAYQGLRAAELDATSEGDNKTVPLLDFYFTKVRTWGNKYSTERRSLNATDTMGENVLDNDSDWIAIQACEKSLNSLLRDRKYNYIHLCK